MRQTRLAPFVLLVALILGCGAAPTGDVSGTVAYDGQPIEHGYITFVPADGKGVTAGGEIVAGKYSASKVPIGKAKITVSAIKETAKKRMYDDPNAPLVQTSAEILPNKYTDRETTVLEYDVATGPQIKDFQLDK
jgi:hypothetical protein